MLCCLRRNTTTCLGSNPNRSESEKEKKSALLNTTATRLAAAVRLTFQKTLARFGYTPRFLQLPGKNEKTRDSSPARA